MGLGEKMKGFSEKQKPTSWTQQRGDAGTPSWRKRNARGVHPKGMKPPLFLGGSWRQPRGRISHASPRFQGHSRNAVR